MGYSGSGSYQSIVHCDLYIPDYCVNEAGIEKEEAWRTGGMCVWGGGGDECLIYCNPCAFAFKLVPPRVIGKERDSMVRGMMKCVVENRTLIPSPFRRLKKL